MTLNEQITGLESIPTSNAEQFKVKSSILHTLRLLSGIRAQFERERPNPDKVVHLILEALGEQTPPRRPE